MLLASGGDVDARDNQQAAALQYAARKGHLAVVRLLLDAGANANAVDCLGNTPLMEAISFKHAPCVEALLPVSDLRITDRQGRNAFHTSVITGNDECFELLLPLMGDVDVRTVQCVEDDGSPDPLFDETPLHLACEFGQHEMAKALLSRGALRTARDSLQRTSLHDAAHAGHLSCVAMLLGKHGAHKLTPDEVNAADYCGCTPLHVAAYHGQSQVCGKLLAAGARLDTVTSSGSTPLMLAQHKHPSNTALLDLLAGRGPAHPPGTVCGGCGGPETEVRLRTCDGCLVARYCGNACAKAAWPAHKAECRRLQAAREARSTVNVVKLGASSTA
jgi:ankyrin repeat protein